MKHKILLVDDDTEVLEMNKSYFEDAGYLVAIAASAKEAMRYIKSNTFSCIILDVMLPETDGFTFCKTIRSFSDVPIIFLSGKVTEEDRITGLLSGADDYMIKPYSLRELAARIEVNIRRSQQMKAKEDNSSVLEFPPLCIHLLAHKVTWQETDIPLSNKEFDLLSFLAQNVGKTCTFEEIGTAVWGSYLDSDRRSIMVNVSRLRKKLETYTGCSTLIESVWSKGYCFKSK
ncbi:two component system response regulator [Clostridium sp. CAG:411]|jgi:DNA-binding response OmpR family regulator|nr:response regulator transcription factor [Lachnospiraceae bacterium]CDE44124.1 two component system response regulator [Clostridium sp. CAG:411]